MKLFGKDLDTDLVLIAEIGVNHEGSLDLALDLLRAAADAGADAIKFQTYRPDRYIAADEAERLARVSRFCLSEAAHRRLEEEARRIGTHFFSTPVSDDVVGFVAGFSPVIKVASGDLDCEPMIRGAARTGKPVVLSTGLGTTEEIDRAVGWVAEDIGGAALTERLALMHCVTAYPTPIDEANVLSVPFLRERYGLHVGYSNHVIGPDACYAAAALGASLIEVHFTDSKDGRSFRDHQLSFDAADLKALKATLGRIRASLGRHGKTRQPCEAPNLAPMRKGVIAARDLAADTVLAATDLATARSATEFRVTELPELVGRRLRQPVAAGYKIPRTAVD